MAAGEGELASRGSRDTASPPLHRALLGASGQVAIWHRTLVPNGDGDARWMQFGSRSPPFAVRLLQSG